MKRVMALMIAFVLGACAAQDETVTQDAEQAVRDFIEVRQLETVDEIRTTNQTGWEEIDKNFIIFNTRRQSYLVEFARRCWELDEYPIVADVRDSHNRIQARFDTIRGCHIAKIYPLTEGEVAELESIGESPGSRN